MNHGFIDGKKRIAFASTDIFLGLNGFELNSTPDHVIKFIYKHLEAGTFTKDVLHAWLKDTVDPVKGDI